jgi:hypothetical protein
MGGVFLAIVLSLLFIGFNIYCAIRSYTRGHKLLFVIGIFVPVAWWLGAFLPPPRDGHWI